MTRRGPGTSDGGGVVLGGVFGSQFGARAGRNLSADLFRFLLALLVLSVGFRFAVELVAEPVEPFSIAVAGPQE